MYSWSVFLKMHKKSYWPPKTPFWSFLAVNNGFLCIFKNTDKNNICVYIVLKAETEIKIRKKKIGWPPKKGIFEFGNKNFKKKISSYFSFV